MYRLVVLVSMLIVMFVRGLALNRNLDFIVLTNMSAGVYNY